MNAVIKSVDKSIRRVVFNGNAIRRIETTANAAAASEKEGPDQSRKRKKLIVFGGNGYVGQAVIRQALIKDGVDVISINRSGQPDSFRPPLNAAGKVEWLKGDIFDSSTWLDAINTADGAISCVGAFGSNEFMEKINGDANINAIQTALKAGIPRFVYVSTVENNLPSFFLKGYFNGKRRAEKALLETYPQTGYVLRPGFIHGTRNVPLPSNPIAKSLDIPLWVLGKPMEKIFNFAPIRLLRHSLPGLKAILAPPVSRENLGKVAVAAALGEIPSSNREASKGILTIEDIQRESHISQ